MSVEKLPSYTEVLKELRSNLKELLAQESLQVFDIDADQLKDAFINILKVEKGDKAPDFTLSNAIGENINLYSRLKSNRVVLVFYRGSWCPYCNLVLSQYQSILKEKFNLAIQ